MITDKPKKMPKGMKHNAAAVSSTEPELGGDLIREILIKLPVKSLLRFKQVSKTWLHMITSNSFISSHYSVVQNRQSAPSYFIVRYAISGDQIVSFITQISMETSTIRIDQDMHLQFLLEICEEMCPSPQLFSAGFGLYCIFDWITQRVALWNPGTRKLEVMPPFHDRIHPEYKPAFFFGHVEYEDNEFSYKVGIFSIRSHNSVGAHRLHLYSSSSNSWKVILTPEESVVRRWMCHGVNLNGKYHILSMEEEEYDYHIMTFDYSSEVFGRIEVPDLPQTNGRRNLMYKSFLTVDDDTLLCLVITWKNEEADHEEFLDLWVMREYGAKESWSKEFTVGPTDNYMRVAGYSESARGFLLQDVRNELYLYNCVSFGVERIPLHVALDYGLNLRLCECTTQSLVPIKGTQT
uniref:F-box domain-containing protein n=1 Tax=Kalanchoe fedtschenkoi TaxID=63787 RepID=A0A7N0VIJ3_KALFE